MKKSRTRATAEIFKTYGLSIFLIIIISIIAYQFVEPAPPTRLRMATASKEGAYHRYGKLYKDFFALQNIELELVPTSGSVENLQLLKEKKVEVAFVQGGIGSSKDSPELKGLASLYLEPLFIFARSGKRITSFSELEGKRIALGPEGSGTRKIVMQLLADNNLQDSDKMRTLPYGGREGADKLIAGEIDLLFMVTSTSSPLVKELFHQPDITLVNLERAKSYSVLHSYLSHIVMPEGVLDMAANIPANDIHFVAPAATLVAGEEMHPALIDLMMQAASYVHGKSVVLGADLHFPSSDFLDFPLSSEAERYFKHGPPFLQRFLPFWAASLIDRLKFMLLPMLALILPLMKILPPTYRWRVRSKIYRWYDELHQIDVTTLKSRNRKVISDALQDISTMEEDVRLVEVPLSYSQELYNLRLHIELLREKLEREMNNLAS